ncbi:MAG: nitrite/sulfite reductase [Chloroflexi bacterium]|nr:nitrite/sulfite reductase [Chloroflexota bacterium]MYI04798.1 nitrite/sulfite reductase [Chloroflexota bacterium]
MTESRIDTPGVVIPIWDGELDDFETEATAFREQQREEVEFMLYRLRQGVYGQRQPDVHMNRIKLPMGGVTSDQLDGLAEVCETFAPLRKGHITTRQNIQVHFVPLDQMPDMLRVLGKVGLSSREACGNTVRNVTADPWAGISEDEVFDPTPYAGAFVRYWVRNSITQLLPRKFKVYFTGREADSAIAAIHDLAFFSQVRVIDGKEVRGFRVMVGGGLSTMPKEAVTLTDFVPMSDFLTLSEAVIRIFNAADELRKNILKARLKFLVHRVGEEAFREMVDEELKKGWSAETPPLEELLYIDDEDSDEREIAVELPSPNGDAARFEQFLATNVRPQVQDGYSAVEASIDQGDLTPEQFRGLAEILRKYGRERARTTPQQNVVLRWIPNQAVYAVWKELDALGMGAPDAQEIEDVVSCPGTDSCKLGITSSMGLNRAVQERVREMAIDDPLTRKMRIHMSGCPNSCGQHHIADIGFHGAAIKVGNRQIPAYHMFVAGTYRTEEMRLGTLVPKVRIPAKRVPDAVERVIDLYHSDRQDGQELFSSWVDRVGLSPIQDTLTDLTLPPEFSADTLPMFIDWDRQDIYILQRGEGECAV